MSPHPSAGSVAGRLGHGLAVVYGWICWIYPRSFRIAFHRDMTHTFAHRCRAVAETRGTAAVVVFFCRNAGAAFVGALVEWTRLRQAGHHTSRRLRPNVAAAVVQDVRYGLRGLVKTPAFTSAALVTVAVGIGTTTAIFSVVNGVVLEPLPYPDERLLVQIHLENDPTNQFPISVADYQGIEAQQRSFQGVAALARGSATLTGRGRPERIVVGRVTDGMFSTLGIHPIEGRAFLPGEDTPGAALVAVIGHDFRRRHFGLDSAVGETIVLDGRSHTVVGVLDPAVRTLAGHRADVWPILQLQTPGRRGPFYLRGIARLQPGMTIDQGADELENISERLYETWADTFQDRNARLVPLALRDVIVGDVAGVLRLFLGAVGLVLLIAVANVANLTLARAANRGREMAVRTSLGATHSRLVRQLLVEHMLLAVLGGALGLALAVAGLDALVALSPRLPRLDEVRLDGGVLLFVAAVTVGSGVLFGVAPMLRGVDADLSASLRAGGRAGTDGRRWNMMRSALVAGEFALALPLLAGAALLLTSLARLNRVDAGYDPENLVSARIALPSSSYADEDAARTFWDRALPMITAVPGVRSAGIGSAHPPDQPGMVNNFDLLDKPVPEGTSQPVAPWSAVSRSYFDVLGISLLRGRLPDDTDEAGDPRVLAVSRTWAARHYPGEDPIGKEMYEGGCTSCSTLTVVGVVSDVKYQGLSTGDLGAVYQTSSQYTPRGMYLFVRTEGAPGDVMERVRNVIASLDPALPLANIETMQQRLRDAVAQPRYWASLAGLFAAVGAMLAAVGIYGVLSYFVSRQTREIGMRMALGADASVVRNMIVRRGMSLAAIGLAIGVGGTLALSRWLESLLFGVSAHDPTTLGGMVVVLLLVAFAACYLPAWRATRVDPVRALAAE